MRIVQHDSVDSVTQSIRVTKLKPHSCLENSYWTGRKFRDWQECMTAAGQPWQQGADEIKSLAATLTASIPAPVSKRRRGKWDEDHGDEIDIDRLRTGMAPWRRAVRQSVTGPRTAVITVNISALGSVGWESLKWRGIAAVVLTDLLEQAGWSVQLECVRHANVRNISDPDVYISFTAKRAGDPVSVDSLATAVSVWFYRTVILQTNEIWGGEHGMSSTQPTRGYFDHLSGKDAVLIELETCDSQSRATDWIQKQLANLSSSENL